MFGGLTGFKGFPGGSDGKESACNAGYPGLIPRSGRCPAEGNGLPTPVFLPRKFHGERSLVGYSAWDWGVERDLESGTHKLACISYLTLK